MKNFLQGNIQIGLDLWKSNQNLIKGLNEIN